MKKTLDKAFFASSVCWLLVSTVLGQTVVGPDEVLPITSSTAENFLLNGGTLAPTNVTVSGLIEIQNASAIIRPQNNLVFDHRGNLLEESTGPTTLSGLISGAGDLEFGNESRDLFFISGNNTYSGQTFITAGRIFATTSTAFGSTAEGTTVLDGFLTVQAPTEELFRVEGGTLFFDAGDFVPNGPLTIAGGNVFLPPRQNYSLPIVVDGPGGSIRFGFDDTASWTGGSTGTGNLRLEGRVNVDAPLTHDGDLIIDGVKLNAVNSYTGKTIIQDNYEIDRPDVFGTALSPLEIDESYVTVNVIPNGNRGFIVRRGTLDIQTTDPINSNIILGGGFEANIRGIGTFNGPIDYITTPGGGRAVLWSGVFNGPIRGTTDLGLGAGEGVVVLNAANQIDGRVRIGGTVVVNHAEAITLAATQIETGTLELNVPATQSPFMTGAEFSDNAGVLRLNVDQQIEKSWTLYAGTIEPTANVSFQSIRLLGGNGPARIVSAEGGSTEIAGELVVYGFSEIGGKVTGEGTIRTVVRTSGGTLSVLGDLTGFTGDFRAENGRLSFGRSSSSAPGVQLNPNAEIHVGELGSLEFQAYDIVIENDIYLSNANGTDKFTGALIYRGNGRSQTLAGRIDVGDQGSTIVGAFDITGEFTGTNLTHRGSNLSIRSPQNGLQGTLRLAGGGISLDERGSFSGLDEVRLENGALIHFRPSDNGDRIEDSTLIRSQGGRITLTSNSLSPTSETLGILRLEQNQTSIIASSDHSGLAASLTFNSVEREKGTLLYFNEAGNATSTRINNVSTFDGQMIGAWAIRKDGFASIDANGLIGTVASTTSDLNTAGPSDYVRIAGDVVLGSDKTIASLQHDEMGDPFALDLNGYRLAIRSGGIFRSAIIKNGSLTAGDIGEDAELIIHQGSSIEADIIDNSETGSVSFVMGANRSTVRLSGNNSYTGGTWVLGNNGFSSNEGQLVIENIAAIPDKDRVYIDGGVYNVSQLNDVTIQLDALHLRGNGRVNGFNAPIDAKNVYLEYGMVSAPLTGDGNIFKDSDEKVVFGSTRSPNFTGQVVVREGTLSLDPATLPQATYQIDGGRVDFSGNRRGVANPIYLNGGALRGGRLTGDVFVDADSTLIGEGFATNLYGRLIGDANLTIDGRLGRYFDGYVGIFGDASEFRGDFNVRSGPLRIGAPAQLGDGIITVQEGGRLILASDQETSPATQVDNTIYLRGGTLISAPPRRSFSGVAPPSFATGDVYVYGEAFIGSTWQGNVEGQPVPGLTFSGRLILEDEASVYGLSDSAARFYPGERPLLEISGQLLVGENTSWKLATASLLISGSIIPNAAQSSIDFQGVESSLVLRNTDFVTIADKSLAITINGKNTGLTLQGEDASITGDGGFTGNVELRDGATVSPGNSPGELTIFGDTTMGPGAVYEWELNAISGDPGLAWDLLSIEGELNFEATPENPWVFELTALPLVSLIGMEPWIIASASNIEGFNPDAVRIDLSSITDTHPNLNPENFLLFTRGGNLFLQAVPEPASWMLVCLGTMLVHVWRKRDVF